MRYLVLVGLIVGGLLGYYVLWSHLSDQMAARAEAWIEAQRKQGREAGYESRRQWGFPYRLSLTLKKAYWADARLPLAPRLEVEEITAHLQLWSQQHVIFELSGRQGTQWREAGGERQASLTSERFRASLVTDGAGNWLRLAADLGAPQLRGPVDGPWRGDWTADKLLLHARRAENVPPSTDLALQADRVTLPPQAETSLGRLLQGLRLTGTLRGGIYGLTAEEMLSSWREAGGLIDFTTIALAWGEVSFNGTGSLTVDRDFRPLGAMSGALTAGDQAIAALQGKGLVGAQQAAAARQALARSPEQTEKGSSFRQAAVTAQDGRLSLGDVPLLSLPSVLPDR
jgi:hypothetical protein